MLAVAVVALLWPQSPLTQRKPPRDALCEARANGGGYRGLKMNIGKICTRAVVTCLRETSATALAQLMRDRNVGDVIVVDEHEGRMTPVGLVTDRDLVVKVLAEGIDPARERAEGLMTNAIVTAFESELMYDAIWHMRSKGIRRLPVVDTHNHLLGILTADDVLQFLAEELTEVARIAPRQIKREEAARDPATS